MKKARLLICLMALMASFSLNGCMKDDNPVPDILNDSWSYLTHTSVIRLTFKDGVATLQFKAVGSDYQSTLSTGTYFEYVKHGQHSWAWKYDGYLFKADSYGYNHVIVTSMPDETSDNPSNVGFSIYFLEKD